MEKEKFSEKYKKNFERLTLHKKGLLGVGLLFLNGGFLMLIVGLLLSVILIGIPLVILAPFGIAIGIVGTIMGLIWELIKKIKSTK